MKKRIMLIAFFIFACAVAFKEGQKRRSSDAFGYAAEWGCYQGARKACEHFEKEEEQFACEEDALEFCPKAGQAFKKFMDQGRRR